MSRGILEFFAEATVNTTAPATLQWQEVQRARRSSVRSRGQSETIRILDPFNHFEQADGSGLVTEDDVPF
jgi:hypothetical protein